MRYREFGKTGMKVSEVGFGAWGIGGDYGAVEKTQAMAALEKAEELGCNFVDTASVYSRSEEVLGEFLCSRRDRWLLATKYSGQKGGMIAWAEKQLRVLRTDRIDFYQIHWVPREDGEPGMYDELYRLKKSGKARFVGVSLYTAEDIDYVLDHQHIDGFQIKFSLLDPQPFLQRLGRIRDAGLGIIIRSCFKEGFLTGKFTADSTFPDPADQRHKWGHGQIQKTVEDSERFRFLEKSEGSMSLGAARYPLSFAETSTLILGTKSVSQAEFNFGKVPGGVLADETRRRIATVQKSLVQ